MKNKIITFVVIIALLMCAWAPWLTEKIVARLVIQKHAVLWRGVLDNPSVSGVANIKRLPFGVQATLLYQGGLAERTNSIPTTGGTVFVSFVGTIHGLQSPEDIFRGR